MTSTIPESSNDEVLPRYYLQHDTPHGVRVAYPRPTMPRDGGLTWALRDATWSAVADGEEIPVETVDRGAQTTPWLIASRPFDELAIRWTEPGPLLEWRRADNAPTDPVARNYWNSAPPEPTADAHEHLSSYHDDDCVSCGVLRQVYARPRGDEVQREHRIDMSAWRRLDAPIDPAPGLPWLVTDSSLTAIYGQHTAHLWPGRMPGFRDAVVAALSTHPMIAGQSPTGGSRETSVYDHDRDGTVKVFYKIRWDLPKRRARRDGDRGRGPFFDKIAVTAHVAHKVPGGLAAVSKADALAAWDDAVAEQVATFAPDADGLQGCSACSGRGYLLSEPRS